MWIERVANISSLAAQQAQSSKGITQGKQALRQKLSRAAVAVANPTRVWALDNENAELAERMSISVTSILRASDKDAADLCQNIHAAAATAPTSIALTPYGVKPAKIKALQDAINAFSDTAPKPRLKIKGRKSVTGQLDAEIRAADRLLSEGLDLMVDQFAEEHPEFVADYKNARAVVRPPTAQKTAKKAADKSAATTNPAPDLKVA